MHRNARLPRLPTAVLVWASLMIPGTSRAFNPVFEELVGSLSPQNFGDVLGIGIDLTPAYGTIAVSFTNGSNLPLARVEGGALYRELMCGLPDQRWEQDTCAPGRHPPNETAVHVVGRMLEKLAKDGSQILGQTINAAAVTCQAAHYGGLTRDLIEKAFANAGLQYIDVGTYSPLVDSGLSYPEHAVLAGNDLGLCQPYSISYADCIEQLESKEDPFENYFLVGYYANALEVTAATRTSLAYNVLGDTWVSFFLGLEARYKNPSEEYYWEEVRKLLSMPFVRRVDPYVPNKVILYGDKSGNSRFRGEVNDVLNTWFRESKKEDWIYRGVASPEFAGAMGAAEFMKRNPFWRASDEKQLDLIVQKPEL